MGQEGVTQPGSGRGSGCKTSNIDTGEVGGDTRGRLVGLAEPVVSWVRDEDTGFLGVDGGIREVGSVRERGLWSEAGKIRVQRDQVVHDVSSPWTTG
jgi:hypothetical protein